MVQGSRNIIGGNKKGGVNSIGNVEAKELTRMTDGVELKGAGISGGRGF